MKYPLEKQKNWHTDQDYKETDGKLVNMSPEKFLKQVRPMDFDKRDKTNLERQLDDYEKGERFEPLQLRADGTEDGRHRAVAAMIKGIKEVPVLKWQDRDKPDDVGDKGVMKQIKKVVKKFRESEKYK